MKTISFLRTPVAVATACAVVASMSVVSAVAEEVTTEETTPAVEESTTEETTTEEATTEETTDEETTEETTEESTTEETPEDPTEPAEPTDPETPDTPGAIPTVKAATEYENTGVTHSFSVNTLVPVSEWIAESTVPRANLSWRTTGESTGRVNSGGQYMATVTDIKKTTTFTDTLIATDTRTGTDVVAVKLTVTAKPATPADTKPPSPQPATSSEIGILVGVVGALVAGLAAMVQFLVPGGWPRVLNYFF